MWKQWTVIALLLSGLATVVWAGAPTTLEDFFVPGSQPLQSGNIEHPNKCDNCHGGYDLAVEPAFSWRGSMMAQAARDPLFYACLTIANQDAPDSGDLCIRCHSPDGWLNGRSIPTDGSALNNNDREGVQCDFCHKLVKPTPLGANPFPNDPDYTAGAYPQDQSYLSVLSDIPPQSGNGGYVADQDNAKRGPYVDAAARHQMLYSPFHREAALCGTCHDVSNPAFSKGPNGKYVANEFGVRSPSFDTYEMFPIERTYSEWLKSDYNSATGVFAPQFGGNKQYVSTCQDCHMRDVTGAGCNKKGAPVRDDLPLHDMTGGNTFIPALVAQLYPDEVNQAALDAGIARARQMLQAAASLELSVVEATNGYDATVRVTNETGHKLPSGYPEGRRIWLNVKAYDEVGALVYESGAYDVVTGVLHHDPDIKVYEIKPGISAELAPVLGLAAGPSFHFAVNHEIFFDNRIPPRGFTNENFEAIQSPPVGYAYADGQFWDETIYNLPNTSSTVVVTLYYQVTSKEYVEFLRDENVTNDWGNILYDLWVANGKAAPEVMNTLTYEIPAAASPVAEFSADPTSGTVPLTVQFSDLSTNGPSSWNWDFGDGGTATDQNPVHTYAVPGTYDVSLSVSNAYGSNSQTKNSYIVAAEAVTVHVADIVVTRVAQKSRISGVATVTVVDAYAAPVAGASVTGQFTGPTAGTSVGTTDASGQVVLQSKAIRNPSGEWCFEVTDVATSGGAYDPAANVVTQACESGAVFAKSRTSASPDFGILGNQPNPFNPTSEIRFATPAEGHVVVEIYNVRGQKLATLQDGSLPAGVHRVTWQSEGVPSGVYLCILRAGERIDTRSLTVLK